MTATPPSGGNHFEDFRLGQRFRHATPRTASLGDVALYTALTGSRFALHSADTFAQAIGLPRAPLDDLLVFHLVFGKSVADISRNAVANLGYAEGVFGAPVYPGDTVCAESEVIGLRQNSNGRSGTVHVRTSGRNQRGETVLAYVRWVMVRKRDAEAPPPEAHVPTLAEAVAPEAFVVPEGLDPAGYDTTLAGDDRLWEDFAIDQRIDHGDGMTIEDAEHMMATRLYQNTARVHFDAHAAHGSRFGRRVVYGGHVISLARALSFNGLANACRIMAINGGRHVAPIFAGDTVYAWTRVLDKAPLAGRDDLGALRLNTVAAKDHACADHPHRLANGDYHPAVVLDFDYWALMPRRG